MRGPQLCLDLCARCATCIVSGICGRCTGPCTSFVGNGDQANERHVVSARNERMDLWLRDVGGTLEFDGVAAPRQREFALPAYLPAIKYQSKSVALPPHDAYAVPLTAIVTPRAQRIADLAANLRRRLGVPGGAKIVWLPWETDDLLENFWTNHRGLLSAIAAIGLDCAAAPNFSVYGDQPRFYHLLNMKRSLILYCSLAERGILSMPHVYWWDTRDIERWASWLNDNEPCEWIAVNMQTARSRAFFREMVRGLEKLSSLCNRRVKLLVGGVAARSRVRELASVRWEISITHYRAHILATQYRVVDERGIITQVEGLSYEEMLARNVAAYSSIAAETLR